MKELTVFNKATVLGHMVQMYGPIEEPCATGQRQEYFVKLFLDVDDGEMRCANAY